MAHKKNEKLVLNAAERDHFATLQQRIEQLEQQLEQLTLTKQAYVDDITKENELKNGKLDKTGTFITFSKK